MKPLVRARERLRFAGLLDHPSSNRFFLVFLLPSTHRLLKPKNCCRSSQFPPERLSEPPRYHTNIVPTFYAKDNIHGSSDNSQKKLDMDNIKDIDQNAEDKVDNSEESLLSESAKLTLAGFFQKRFKRPMWKGKS